MGKVEFIIAKHLEKIFFKSIVNPNLKSDVGPIIKMLFWSTVLSELKVSGVGQARGTESPVEKSRRPRVWSLLCTHELGRFPSSLMWTPEWTVTGCQWLQRNRNVHQNGYSKSESVWALILSTKRGIHLFLRRSLLYVNSYQFFKLWYSRQLAGTKHPKLDCLGV